MKSTRPVLGRLLKSVATCYSHPCAVGWRLGNFGASKSRRGWQSAAENCRFGGVAEPRDERLSRLEAVFFLSQQPQSRRRVAQLAGLADGTKARTLVRALNRRYDAEGSAFRVEEVAGGFQLMTRAKFAPWLRRLHSAQAEVRLSAPAMETLAVVAYRQPVLRVDVEAIRGVQSGEVLRQLIERDLVRIVGRSEELGRPFLYGTTKHFLQVFGLRHLDELPRAEVLRTHQPPTSPQLVQTASDVNTTSQSIQSPEAEEEINVKTLITPRSRQEMFAEELDTAVLEPRPGARPGRQGIFAKQEEENDEDFDDEEFDDEEDDEEEDEEELDEESWEEVEDDEDLDEDEDEDWDDEEEEDWEDDDEDWDDDEDDDWEDDEEEEEEDDE